MSKASKSTFTADDLNDILINDRGEKINTKVVLLTDKQRGQVWRRWATRLIPAEIYREFRLLDSTSSEKWLNVVEHNIFVAAAALTLGHIVQKNSLHIKPNRIIRGAIVHDATKRVDVESHKTREAASNNLLLAEALQRRGYDYTEITTALNTGRLADRFVTDPSLRRHYIAAKPLEAVIFAYADARTCGSRIYSLTEAKKANLAAKLRPEDTRFYNDFWFPYYQAVEAYIIEHAPDFEPAQLTDDAVYRTVQKAVKAQHQDGHTATHRKSPKYKHTKRPK